MSKKEKPSTRKASPRRWSKDVTEHSHALELEAGAFTLKDPKKIAASLKRSAEASKRRKSDPFRSAMSMLVFYVNRAGKNLNATDRARLDRAKQELRRLFGKVPSGRASKPH
jgi:Protein of unknown function (DUF3175)